MAITNHERCLRAEKACAVYDEDDPKTSIVDLLTDLRHLCASHHFDFDAMLLTSEIHFNCECDEEE